MVQLDIDSSPTASISRISMESDQTCRFCLCGDGEATHLAEKRLQELLCPCPCRGSAKYVHLGCLIQHFEARGEWHNFKCPSCDELYEGTALRELAKLSCDHMVEEHGDEAVHVAHSMCFLASAHSQLGNACESRDLLVKCLAIEEQHFGIGHVTTATTLVELATAHGKLGDVQKQKELLERSLAIKEKHYGEGHFSTAVILNNLATVQSDLGDVSKQRELLERSLRIKEQHFGKDHVQCAATLVNLAGVYSELGDAKKCQELLRQSLAIAEQHFGVGHVETAIALNNLALAHGETGDFDGMQQLLEQCLEIKDRHFGVDHLESSLTLANLAVAHSLAGKLDFAKTFSDRALAACRKEGSKSSRRYGVVLLRAAVVYRALDLKVKAEQFASHALQILGEVLGAVVSARMISSERSRLSKFWYVAHRYNIVKWLETTLVTDSTSTKGKHTLAQESFAIENAQAILICDSPPGTPRVNQEHFDVAIAEYMKIYDSAGAIAEYMKADDSPGNHRLTRESLEAAITKYIHMSPTTHFNDNNTKSQLPISVSLTRSFSLMPARILAF